MVRKRKEGVRVFGTLLSGFFTQSSTPTSSTPLYKSLLSKEHNVKWQKCYNYFNNYSIKIVSYSLINYASS